MSKKKNNEIIEDLNKDLPTNQTGEEITQSVNPEADKLENKDTENEQEPGANEGNEEGTEPTTKPGANEGENDSVNNPDENDSDEDDSQDEPKVSEVTLKVEVNFTDKYDKSIKYKAGKKYSFKAERANELLNDPRGLVSEVK